jgi:hypothetical protein
MSHKPRITKARELVRLLRTADQSCSHVAGYWKIASTLALALLMIGFLIPLPNGYRAIWFSRLQDTLHAPVFAFVAICLRFLFHRTLLQTFALACGVAVSIEVFQAGVGRSMSLNDLAFDGFGLAAAFVLLRTPKTQERWFSRCCRITFATTFLLAPLALESPVLIDAWRAAREFPVVADFSSRGATQRWYSSGIRMRRVLDHGTWRGEIQNGSSQTYGSAILLPVIGDWSEYDRVCCEFSFAGPPMQILISARDANGRIDNSREYTAGTHRVCVNLRHSVTAGALSHLDLTRVQSFHFALYGNPGRTALIHSVQLE